MNREQWLQERMKGIGASEAAVALGLSKWATPLQLWGEKTGRLPAKTETMPMKMGKLLEPVIAQLYTEDTGRKIIVQDPPDPYPIQFSEKVPFLFATPDAWVKPCRAGDSADRVARDKDLPDVIIAEFQTTGALFAHEWDDEPPLDYQVQGMHQLFVTGLEWVSFGVLIANRDFRWKDMRRDHGFIDEMVEKLGHFWECVTSDTPPPVTSPNDLDALKMLYPKDTREDVDLPDEALGIDSRRMEVCALLADLEKEKKLLSAQLQAMIGEASGGRLPDGSGRYTWKEFWKDEYVVKGHNERPFRRSKGGR